MLKHRLCFCLATGLYFALLTCPQVAWVQIPKAVVPGQTAPPPSKTPEAGEDPLGRTTPRGTVLGFLSAAYNQKYDVAAEYLDTHTNEQEAVELAKQLFFVLDRKLPAKLNSVSNDPLGTLSDPVDSKRELIGTVVTQDGSVDIYLERVVRHGASIWLFSRETLASIPDVYDEINATTVQHYVPDFLFRKFLGVSLFALTYFLVFLPLLYVVLSVVNSLGSAALKYIHRRWTHRSGLSKSTILPHPVRLLILAITIAVTIRKINLSLFARQIGSTMAALLLILAFVWAMFRMNERLEAYFKRRLKKQGRLSATAILRPARRLMDFIAILIGLMIMLHKMGINASTTLAGLGVGGIAIALAAQKTLENIIGGASLIMDGSIRVGDFFKAGTVTGTIEVIGLRSTTVRTPDRTIVTIPNGQMATMTLENFSARDNFWLRQLIGIEYQTPPAALTSLLVQVRELLERDSRIVPATSRARFVRFAESNLELEVVAYILADSWDHFLEIQEELLIKIRALIETTGVGLGYPARAIFLKSGADLNIEATQDLPKAAETSEEAGREMQNR